MKNKKNSKSKYYYFGIFIFLWLLLISGLSYAYFAVLFNNNDKTNVSMESGVLAIDFETGEYITNLSSWPINDADIFDSEDRSTFSVKKSSTNTVSNVYYNIYLDDIVISNEFKSADVKWKLYNVQNPTSSTTPIGEGNFANIGNNTTIQLNNQIISLTNNDTHYYTLFLWISNNPNQNQADALLGGEIEGKIKIEAVTQ